MSATDPATTRPVSPSPQPLIFRQLDSQPYDTTWQAMRDFTDQRDDSVNDEIWMLQHPPVYTLGQAGKREHILGATDIPVVQSDRGGQVTYHGPGQLIAYTLLNLRRRGLGVRDLVIELERSIINLLASYGVNAAGRRDAPGVYVEGRKIAALGLRVRRGCCYHGLSLNVNLDLAPFNMINPCGYPGLDVTSTQQLGMEADCPELAKELQQLLKGQFG